MSPSRLRQLARARPKLAIAAMLVPLALVLGVDVSMRGGRLLAFEARYLGSYGVSLVESALLWACILVAASARRGLVRWGYAAALVAMAGTALGGQIYFYRRYSTYLNLDATLFGASMSDSLAGQLGADGLNFVAALLPVMVLAGALVALGRVVLRPRRRVARIASFLAPLCIVGALTIPCSYRSVQGSTPDVIYFHALGGLAKQRLGVMDKPHVRPRRRRPQAVPAMKAAPAKPRNVLFILTESVRADVGCSAPSEDCGALPFTNAALPRRLGLTQMRSNASTTAIQLAVLWTGLPPTAGRDALHDSPSIFELARAGGYATAYWTSHHMLFANSRLWVQDLPLDAHCHATTLDPLADIDLGARDDLLTERVKKEIGTLREPFFAHVQYGNTHIPYRVDPERAPYQPSLESKAPEDNDAYRNFYKNAVHLQDETIAELVKFVRAQPFGDRTVIVYTSDHGEQFREHGQLGHTGSLFDVEIRVPTWIDAPPGTLTDGERTAIAKARDAATFHTDLAPTVLDLLGLWDAAALAPFKKAMVGAPLTRPAPPARVLELTNCAGVWGCAFENWGVMRGRKKVIAREWDGAWLCYDTVADPEELHPLPIGECPELHAAAKRLAGRLPGE